MKVMVYKIVNHGTIPSRRLSGRLNNMWVCSTCYGGILILLDQVGTTNAATSKLHMCQNSIIK